MQSSYTDNPPLYGDHILQISWVATIANLKKFLLRNVIATTPADEDFLFRIPEKYPTITWKCSGTITLSHATCKRYGFAQCTDVYPVRIDSDPSRIKADGVRRIGVKGNLVVHEKQVPLESAIVRLWRDEMYCNAGAKDELILIFDELKAVFVYQFEIPMSDYLQRGIRFMYG
jgi:hypothetical protein